MANVNWSKIVDNWINTTYNPAPYDLDTSSNPRGTDNGEVWNHPNDGGTTDTPLLQTKKKKNFLDLLEGFGSDLGKGLLSGTEDVGNNALYLGSKLVDLVKATPNPTQTTWGKNNGEMLSNLLNKGESYLSTQSDALKNQNNDNIGFKIGSAIPSLGMAFIPGAGLGLSAANAAGEGGRQAQAEGKSGLNELGNALAKGALNYGLMKLPLGSLGKVGDSALTGVAKTAGLGAGAGALGSVGNTATDKLFVNPNEQFNPTDIASNALVGGLLGGGSKTLSLKLNKPTDSIQSPSNVITPLEKATATEPINSNITMSKTEPVLKAKYMPMEQRDFSNVGDKNINAYQYDNPEVKPFIQSEANILKGELERTIPGQRSVNYVKGTGESGLGEAIDTSSQRITSDSIANIKDITGASYDKIGKAIDNIIKDSGAENNALSKKVELIIDDRLNNGYYDDVTGMEIPPNNEYKNAFNSADNTPVNPSVGANDRLQSVQTIVSGKSTRPLKQKLSDTLDNFKINAYDINAPISKVDKATYQAATNSKKVGGTVGYILNNDLVDMNGKKIGEGLGNIAKDIPQNQEKEFFNYILQKHNIDRAAQGKPVFEDFTPEDSQKAVSLIEQKHPEYKQLGNRLTNFINSFENEWGNKSGLMSNDLWSELQNTYKNYVPTQRSFSELEKGIQATNGKGFVDQSNSLKRATGSARDVINPIENISNLVNRTVRTARYNEVGQNLLKAIQKNPVNMSKYAEIIPKGEKINNNVDNVVSVLKDGQPVNIQINDKNLLESLKGLNKGQDLNMAENVLGKANQIFKDLITTKNPVFGLRNMARDLPTAYVYGSEHNPLKFGANYLGAMKDLITNSPTAQQYKSLGGESANFFNSDKAYQTADQLMNRKIISDKETGEIMGSKKINPVLKAVNGVNNGVEKFNNIIESAPRLAEYKATIKKGGTPQEALYNAGEVTTNFSRGGKAVKRLDISVPYLNASVQGLGKFAEQITKKPIQTLAKGAFAITVPSLAMQAVNSNNPNYQALDNRTKDNYFLFPNMNGPKDSNGNAETFIKIPKSRELGALLGDTAERAVRAANGESNAFKDLGNTIATNIAPNNPLDNNLFSPIAINLPTNKDFAGRTIVPTSMQNLSPQYQYDEKTTDLAKGLGQLTNLSPKQIDYVIKSYTGVLGQMLQAADTPANYNSAAGIDKVLSPVTNQFNADSLYSNQNLQNFYDNYDKAKTAAADKNFTENIPLKTVTNEETASSGFARASKEMSALSKQADLASRAGDNDTARQLRMQMLQIAMNANNGTFPATKSSTKKSTSTKKSKSR